MFDVGILTPAGVFHGYDQCETLEDEGSQAGAIRWAHWLREDMFDMEDLESGSRAVVFNEKGEFIYEATADNGFD